MKRYYILVALCTFYGLLSAQNKVYGFRGGLTSARLYGPSEKNAQGHNTETHKRGYGYFFSFTSRYGVDDNFGVKTEIGYALLQSNYAYNGPAFREFRTDNGTKIQANGQLNLNMTLSNGYFVAPILCYYRPDESPFEWAAGLQFEVLLYSKGQGQMQFEGQTTQGTPIPAFNTTVNFNYIYDDSLKIAYYPDKFVEENGLKGRVPSLMGAYTEWRTKPTKYYQKVSTSAVFELNFHISEQWSLGLRTCIGLLDITNDRADFSRQQRDAQQKPIVRRDYDHYISAIGSLAIEF